MQDSSDKTVTGQDSEDSQDYMQDSEGLAPGRGRLKMPAAGRMYPAWLPAGRCGPQPCLDTGIRHYFYLDT